MKRRTSERPAPIVLVVAERVVPGSSRKPRAEGGYRGMSDREHELREIAREIAEQRMRARLRRR